MRKKGKTQNPVQLKDVVLNSIADKKGKNVVCLNMKKISGSLCDYFIICEGDSSVQVGTIAKAVEQGIEKAKFFQDRFPGFVIPVLENQLR